MPGRAPSTRTGLAQCLSCRRNWPLNRKKTGKEQAATRKLLVGSGDRSERIRTYNYPQGRVTDHRINLTLYKLEDIVEGELDSVITPLLQEYQAEMLASLSEG